ncbi:hypothetical protein [Sciscionella marina]|uniref:hypothetical protein n=1 Tax=Sciscionella marina TaxID=508770 RepID=UPI0003769DB3|nr:hypothetical protein [Sciscionella marina]
MTALLRRTALTDRPQPARLARAHRWAPWVLGATAVTLVPWAGLLAARLPDTTEVRHWSTAWAGLDLLLAAGCGTTAVLRHRASHWSSPAAAATATAAVLDVWFDVLTAQPGAPLTTALALGAVELAFAGYCVMIAVDREIPARASCPRGPVG